MRSSGKTRLVRAFRGPAVAAALLLAMVAPPSRAQATQAAALYGEAMAREAALRKELASHRPNMPSEPLLRRIRVLVGSYRDLARLFPTDGHSDNALWQGGLLAADAYRAFGDAVDRSAAVTLLNALPARFPTSSLVRQVPVEIAREVPFTDERLDAPARVFIDLQNARPSAALQDATIPFSEDVVKQIRVGRQIGSRTRVALDLTADRRYSVYALYDPYRIIIDFERPEATAPRPAPLAPATTSGVTPRPVAPPAPTPGAKAPPLAPVAPLAPIAPGTALSLSRQLGLGIARIAIDPGHGGRDPGAKIKGLTESNLVLDVALRLEKLLKSQNVEVVLTRRTNEFVPLEERTAIANKSGADLFLSIHANASGTPSVRGIETYFLNFAPNPEAEAIAAREN